MSKGHTDYERALLSHYAKTFGEPESIDKWTSGPVHKVQDLSVARYHESSFGARAYATLSFYRETNLELFVLCRAPDLGQVELLTIIAYFHRWESRLGLGHTVNFGRPWQTDSTCSFGLLSHPYTYGPKLQDLDSSFGPTKVLWLVPITEQERDYKIKFGLEALEERLEESGFDFLDPMRASVCK